MTAREFQVDNFFGNYRRVKRKVLFRAYSKYNLYLLKYHSRSSINNNYVKDQQLTIGQKVDTRSVEGIQRSIIGPRQLSHCLYDQRGSLSRAVKFSRPSTLHNVISSRSMSPGMYGSTGVMF